MSSSRSRIIFLNLNRWHKQAWKLDTSCPVPLHFLQAFSRVVSAPQLVIRDYIILISLLENEALRNLMISWYFAGYYTGLYEGQQKQ